MDSDLVQLSNYYRYERDSNKSYDDAIKSLHKHYIRLRERSLLEAASAAAGMSAFLFADDCDSSEINPQMEEAFHLAFPGRDISTITEYTEASRDGLVAAWKGKYFEVIVRDKLNNGEWVGDIHLSGGQVAQLAESPTQPGWDLQIVDADGSIAREIQLKATESLSYVKTAIIQYPDVEILVTDEVFERSGDSLQNVLRSDITNDELNNSLLAPMKTLFDSSIEDFAETVLPGLPFVIIAVGEGRHVLVGQKSLGYAARGFLNRTAKTGIAMGIGLMIYYLDGGLLSIPATFLTRMGFERSKVLKTTVAAIDRRTEEIRSIPAR